MKSLSENPGTSPPVAVILPARNAAATLEATLRSLWRQSHAAFEVLAVDDGSTDDTPEILTRHASRDHRLRVFQTPGRGLVAALEEARAATRAPFLARLDADDICHPRRLERQLEYLETHPRTAAVGSRIALFPFRALGPGWHRYQAWLNGLITPEDHARERFVESPLAHPSVMLRAESVNAVGGYRDLPWAEDYDLWLRLAEAGWDLAKVDACLLGWRHTPERLSMNSPRYSLGAFQRARAHFLARHPALAHRRLALWGAGRTGRRLARLLEDEGLEIERFYDVDPAKIGRTLRGAPILSWEGLEPPGRLPLVAAVGAAGARALIRPQALARGYREGVDFLFAA